MIRQSHTARDDLFSTDTTLGVLTLKGRESAQKNPTQTSHTEFVGMEWTASAVSNTEGIQHGYRHR